MEERLTQFLLDNPQADKSQIRSEARRLTELVYGQQRAESFGFSRGWLNRFLKRVALRQLQQR